MREREEFIVSKETNVSRIERRDKKKQKISQKSLARKSRIDLPNFGLFME
jgi:hypothetical protein